MRAAALAAVLLLPSVAAAQTKTTVMVKTRDGIDLATDVWRAEGDTTPRPVLLRRTPYGRAIDPGAAKGLTGLGYVVVSEDVRGRGSSSGDFLPFFNDAKDGFDALDWVSKQPFSNGKIGTYGSSAEGVVQLMALGEGHPAQKCAYVGVASDDVYNLMYPGGAWRTELTTAWLTSLMEPEALPILRQHEVGDAFWAPVRLDAAKRAKVKASAFFVAAQYDIFADNVQTFLNFSAEADPSVRGDQFMILGAWTHGGSAADTQGDVTFSPSTKYEKAIEDLVAYFDWCLKGGPRPSFARVRSHVVHFNDDGKSATTELRSGDTWPPALPQRKLFLRADHTLSAELPSGAVDSKTLTKTIAVDPNNPIPSSGGGNLTTVAGPTDQRTIDARADVFLATTEPVDSDVEIIGRPRATIWASSTNDDFDVVVRLSVVTESGVVLLVTDGVRRARFAESFSTLKPIAPGTATKMEVELGPVSVKLTKGQRLRVAVQGTSAPRYEPNPGVAQPLSTKPAAKASMLNVFLERENASFVEVATTGFAASKQTPPCCKPMAENPETAGCACTTPQRVSEHSPAWWLVALLLLRRRDR
jgi:uncharacterized protein